MTIALVQSKSADNGGSSTSGYTVSYTSAVTSGNFLAVAIEHNVSGVSVSDNLNGAWTKVGEAGSSSEWYTSLWVMANAAAGTTTLTVTGGALGTWRFVEMAEYSGVGTSSSSNAHGTAMLGANGTSITVSTTIGSGNASDLVLVASADTNPSSFAPNSETNGYVTDVSSIAHDPCALISNKGSAASGTQSTTIDWTNAGSSLWPSVIGSFSAGGGSTFIAPPPRIVRQAVNRAATY